MNSIYHVPKYVLRGLYHVCSIYCVILLKCMNVEFIEFITKHITLTKNIFSFDSSNIQTLESRQDLVLFLNYNTYS